jgi:probable rRNA maturation factor
MGVYTWEGYQVEVDEETTRAYYSDSIEWECTCGHCRNFVLLAQERRLPVDILALLDKLGIPPEKASYVCELYDKDEKIYYQVNYRLAGRVLEGPEKAASSLGETGLLCGRETAPGSADDFPEPFFDLMYFLWLPWIDNIPLGPHEIILSSDLEEDTSDLEDLLRRVIPAALSIEGVTVPWEVDVLLTDDEGIHAINLSQRGVDAPTDVLSFPMFDLKPGDKPSEADADPGSHLVPLGDMVLNLDRVRSQGEEYGHGPRREAAYLAVHSILHLLGYDHMDDGPMKEQMRKREEAILGKLGIGRE